MSLRLQKTSMYPNGKRKSDLYDFFLSYHDFGCTPDAFAQELEDILLEERLGVPNCEWYVDLDGRRVVAGLSLRDAAARAVITHDGFVFTLPADTSPIVFISYAKEDADRALLVADELGRAGFRPWIDRRRLLGGHRWKTTIEEAIRNCGFFVVLLSLRSIDKRGFVQREIRKALEVAEELPEHRVFIIPVRLDGCEPTHPALREINWIDLFPDWRHGMTLLVRSLHAGQQRGE